MLLTARRHICHPVATLQEAGLWLWQIQGQYGDYHKALETKHAHTHMLARQTVNHS